MNRTLRITPIAEWMLGPGITSRHSRLLDVPQPDHLLAKVVEEASRSARSGRIRLCWQEADECQGYFRLVARVPLEQEATLDQFFNGRSGYRAQYYLSPEEGVLYNRDVLQGLKGALSRAYHQQPLAESLEVVLRTIDGPHAKVWLFDEIAAFNSSPAGSLNPQRWIDNGADRGRRTPLPSHLTLDIKGTFIKPLTGELFVDPLKLDRACDLFRMGYT
ncbi:hypothetical protein [Pseudomonas chlororaphis]|uniref:hypothetical protein n=1 Tax=Pseudomonas chlororaphis TaxID=587753 RepID=UPI000F561059|nr:hypothetical protein [Pseudomonas chlororaphis]